MRKVFRNIALSGILLFTNQTFGQEQKTAPFIQGASCDISAASEYLAGKAGFRVVNHPVIQSYADISTSAGTFYGWSNTRIREEDVNELDLVWVSPELKSKHLGVNTTFAGYTYPNSGKNWNQWDLESGINVFTKDLPVNLNLYAGLNFAGDSKSEVFKLTASKSFDLSKLSDKLKGTRISVEGYTAYGIDYYSKYTGFSHAAFRGELSKDMGNAQVYTALIAQKELNSFGGKINNDLVGIVGVRYNFH